MQPPLHCFMKMTRAIVIQEPLDALLALKAGEMGRVLTSKEDEYLRLQVERNELVLKFPNTESRGEEVLKTLQRIKNRLKKLAKGRPVDDVLKLPLKSEAPKSAAERKRDQRGKMSLEARDKEREENRKRKASPEELERGRKRKKTPEELEKAKERMKTPEQLEKAKERMSLSINKEKDAARKKEKRRLERIAREKEDEWPRVPRLSDSIAAGGGGGDLQVKYPHDTLRDDVNDYYMKSLRKPSVQGPTFSLDQPLRIRAEFTCFPPPTIVWMKDGKVLARDTIEYVLKEGVNSSSDCQKERVAPQSKLRFRVESYYRHKDKLPETSRAAQLVQQGWSDFIIPDPKLIDEGIYGVRIFNDFDVVEDFIQV